MSLRSYTSVSSAASDFKPKTKPPPPSETATHLRCARLVAADGASSPVRKMLGVKMEGTAGLCRLTSG